MLTLTIGTEGVAVNVIVGVAASVGGWAGDGVIMGRGDGKAAAGGICPLASTVNATEVAIAFPLWTSGAGGVLLKVHAKITKNAPLIINKIFFFIKILLLTLRGQYGNGDIFAN